MKHIKRVTVFFITLSPMLILKVFMRTPKVSTYLLVPFVAMNSILFGIFFCFLYPYLLKKFLIQMKGDFFIGIN